MTWQERCRAARSSSRIPRSAFPAASGQAPSRPRHKSSPHRCAVSAARSSSHLTHREPPICIVLVVYLLFYSLHNNGIFYRCNAPDHTWAVSPHSDYPRYVEMLSLVYELPRSKFTARRKYGINGERHPLILSLHLITSSQDRAAA